MICRHWIAMMLIASYCVVVPAQEEPAQEKASVPKAKDLYPLEVGLRRVYRDSKGQETAVVVGERAEGPQGRPRYRMFFRKKDRWKPGFWIEVREDGVWSGSGDPEGPWNPRLRDPLTVGATWSSSPRPEPHFGGAWTNRCEVLEPERIKVPAGEFSCTKIKVTGSLKGGRATLSVSGFRWYAEGVGLVREESLPPEGAPPIPPSRSVLVRHDRMSPEELLQIREKKADVADDVTICKRRLTGIYRQLLIYQTKHKTMPQASGPDFVLEAWKTGIVDHTVKDAEVFFCPTTGNRPLPDLSNVNAKAIDWTGPDQSESKRPLRAQQRNANAVVIVCSRVPTNNGSLVHGGKGVCVLYLGGAVDFIPAERFGGKIVIGPESPLPELRHMVPGP